jgi:hypothetical protein
MDAGAGAWNIAPQTPHSTGLKIPLDFLGFGGPGDSFVLLTWGRGVFTYRQFGPALSAEDWPEL